MNCPPPELVTEMMEMQRGRVKQWHPDIKYEKLLVIDASSFQSWIDNICPEFANLPPVKKPFKADNPGLFPIGDRWVLYRGIMPIYRINDKWVGKTIITGTEWKMNFLQIHNPFNVKDKGLVTFTDTVYIPTLAEKLNDFKPWMSMTPNEVISQAPGFQWAYGRVLVGGMGLGWAAQTIRHLPKVKTVTIVERDKSIAKFFGDIIKKKTGAPIQIVIDDLYRFTEGREKQFDSMILDIWPFQSDSRYDLNLRKLRKRFKGRIWAWGQDT